MRALLKHRRVLLLAGIYGLLLIGGGALSEMFRMSFADHSRMMMFSALASLIVLSAIPFVPGAEIGFALLLMYGSEAALSVYVSMVVALSLAFCLGRAMPPKLLAQAFSRLGLMRASALLTTLASLPPKEVVAHLSSTAPNRIAPFLLRHRYLAVIVALNLPGNVLIGGGGGIAFAAGLSRLFTPARFLLTLLIAVAPIPLAFLLGVVGD